MIKFWLGTYTSSPEQGIHLIGYHPETDKFDSLLLQGEIKNPSFVISNKKGDLLFSVQEIGGEEGGSVCAYKFDEANNLLKKINSSSTLGSGPCYITLDPTEKYIMAGNYSSGNLAVIPINADGSLAAAVQEISHDGKGIDPNRQEAPHVHSLVFHPNGKQVFVADLGTDKVNIYDFDPKNEHPLSPSTPAYFEVKEGSGPRHLVFNQAGDKIYLIHEMTSEVGLYDYNLEENKIVHLDTYPLVPKDFEGALGAAEIRISNDGKFLYASNRGDANEITVFKIDENTGTLDKIQQVSSGGKTPRNFAISPDGEYLFSGNQDSNDIYAFKRNPSTGIIKQLDSKITIHKPVYFFMVK
ncbi:lactonase family protein [Echinicola marina]|uniref:lactonase family protein n=1 Tax=Echinicola marina TaxID=2859768 RepID=UPI001CF630D9|nr:lactonase family protein [Echinicola marina]UCS92820.1 lactonase family protein [Echinicola marina]